MPWLATSDSAQSLSQLPQASQSYLRLGGDFNLAGQ